MFINLLHPSPVALKTKLSFLVLGVLLGFSLTSFLNHQQIRIPDEKTTLASIPPKTESVYCPVVSAVPTDFCDKNSVHQTICYSSKIDPLLKAKIIGDSNPETLFPQKLRISVAENFEPGADFPKEHYAYSSTFYTVTITSLKELAHVSDADGVKGIKEFGTSTLY